MKEIQLNTVAVIVKIPRQPQHNEASTVGEWQMDFALRDTRFSEQLQ